jgi:HlyD family secretion protein
MANGSKNGKRLPLILGGIIAGVVVLAAFVSMRHSVTPVRVATVTRGPIYSMISTNGKIEPIDSFEAHAPAATTVRKIFVNQGDQVKAGQMLLELDSADAQAAAAKAQAQSKAAEADLAAVRDGGTQEEVLVNQAQIAKAKAERDAASRNLDAMKNLQRQGAASPEEVQAAQNRLDAAETDLRLFTQKRTGRFSAAELSKVEAQASEARASLAAAEDLLRKSQIRAPRAGIVYNLAVRQGQYVNAGDLLIAVSDLSTVRARAFVDEPDIGKLRKNEDVELTWDAVPGRIWKGTLTQLPTNITSLGARNVGEITCTIDNADQKLLPNVNVSVNIVTAGIENALTVPREAVHEDGSGRFVFEVANGALKRVPVETSISNLTRIEVTKGLSKDSVVALETIGSRQLQDGLEVRIVQ